MSLDLLGPVRLLILCLYKLGKAGQNLAHSS
jgi:hypothetical protein